MGPDGSKQAPKRAYVSVSLPAPLMERAQRVLDEHPGLGYMNRSSFVEEALRRWIEREEDRAHFLSRKPSADRSEELDMTKNRKTKGQV